MVRNTTSAQPKKIKYDSNGNKIKDANNLNKVGDNVRDAHKGNPNVQLTQENTTKKGSDKKEVETNQISSSGSTFNQDKYNNVSNQVSQAKNALLTKLFNEVKEASLTPEELQLRREQEKKKYQAMNTLSTLTEGLRLVSDTIGGFSGSDIYKRESPIDTSKEDEASKESYLSGLKSIQDTKNAMALKEFDIRNADIDNAVNLSMDETKQTQGISNENSTHDENTGRNKANTGSINKNVYEKRYSSGGSGGSGGSGSGGSESGNSVVVTREKNGYRVTDNVTYGTVAARKTALVGAVTSLTNTDAGKDVIRGYVRNNLEALQKYIPSGYTTEQINDPENANAITKIVTNVLVNKFKTRTGKQEESQLMEAIGEQLAVSENNDLFLKYLDASKGKQSKVNSKDKDGTWYLSEYKE